MFTQGLKTGMYYLRTKPAVQAIQFTVDKTRLAETNKANKMADKSAAPQKSADTEDKENLNEKILACSIQNKDDCLMCGS